MRKSALIVDDSKSARVVLKRMLEVHELDVATAESAESALLYLNDHRPDVIFMDHLMPGMDGFEAVTAIKKNPDTATIPIMMYTSQKGEVYVGQARALGAVGVLPKEVEPVEVSKVLESLRVIGQRVDLEKAAVEAGKNGAELPGLERFDHDLRELIQDLFDQQRAVIRRDLLDSYETIALRVADEIRAPDEDPQAESPPSATREVPARFQIVVAVMAVVIVVFGWLYWQREQSWREAREQNTALLAALEQQQSIETDGAIAIQRRLETSEASLGSAFRSTLDTVAWAVNSSAGYPFGEFPLGERRLALFEGLTGRLLEMGFSGQVLVETYVGNFCMVGGGAEGLELAAPGLRAADCEQLGYESSEAVDLGMRQSVAFANFVNVTEARTGGQIRFVIVSRGNESPLVPYPPNASGVSAGTWNEIALANNRVEISLLPDGF